ncbi:MAG: hypothetical protein ACK551_00510 [Vampirovibrionales bacterium]
MSTKTNTKCPISGLEAESWQNGFVTYYEYLSIRGFAYGITMLRGKNPLTSLDPIAKGKILYWLYGKLKVLRSQKENYDYFILPVMYEHDFIEDNSNIFEETENSEQKIKREIRAALNQKITPTQKVNWLLEYIYHDLESLGTIRHIANTHLFPVLATVEPSEVYDLIEILVKKNYCLDNFKSLGTHDLGYIFHIKTTLEGFEAYEALKKGKSDSNFIFMALEYGSNGDTFYQEHLKSFLQKEGFELKDQRELNKAGNVNVSMEANIRRCRFLIADITPTKTANDGNAYPNPNVMWEAGFAEGLNKPVFYLSGEEIKNFPFDVRNHYCIEYGADPEKACERLKDAIDNTIAKDAQ